MGISKKIEDRLAQAKEGGRKVWELPYEDTFELGVLLLSAIIPKEEGEELNLPLSLSEFEHLFPDAADVHDNAPESYSQYPWVDIITNDQAEIRVSFGDSLTYEISGESRANVGSSSGYRFESS